MEKPNRAIQVYGYTVCVVAIITFLITASIFVTALIDLGDPLHSGWYNGPSLASFENYKMDVRKAQQKPGEEATIASYMPDDATLKAMYESAKDEQIQKKTHEATKSMIVSGILIVISILLFLTHWFWMRRAVMRS